MSNAKIAKELIRRELNERYPWEKHPDSLPDEHLFALIEKSAAECLEAGDELADFSTFARKLIYFFLPKGDSSEVHTLKIVSSNWRVYRLNMRYGDAERDEMSGRNPYAMDNLMRAIRRERRNLRRAVRKYNEAAGIRWVD